MKMILLAFLLTVLCASLVEAGPIESACLRSGNNAASPALCGCIQRVAEMTLQGPDQRRAAGFFQDPDKGTRAILDEMLKAPAAASARKKTVAKQ